RQPEWWSERGRLRRQGGPRERPFGLQCRIILPPRQARQAAAPGVVGGWSWPLLRGPLQAAEVVEERAEGLVAGALSELPDVGARRLAGDPPLQEFPQLLPGRLEASAGPGRLERVLHLPHRRRDVYAEETQALLRFLGGRPLAVEEVEEPVPDAVV